MAQPIGQYSCAHHPLTFVLRLFVWSLKFVLKATGVRVVWCVVRVGRLETEKNPIFWDDVVAYKYICSTWLFICVFCVLHLCTNKIVGALCVKEYTYNIPGTTYSYLRKKEIKYIHTYYMYIPWRYHTYVRRSEISVDEIPLTIAPNRFDLTPPHFAGRLRVL